MLEAVGIRHRFGERVVLDGVDLQVRAGELTGLLGPNGAGKTTLMRLLLGVIEPEAGQIRLDGSPISFVDRQSWGYMPQERGLYPAMKAGDQVAYFGRLHGLPHAQAQRRARRLLSELGLEGRWDDRTDRLSGGQQQRVQLATSLVHEPDVIVLDEPFAGLDPLAVAELSTTLTDRVRAGATIVLSSHQLDLVQDLCESIVMIDQGRMVLSGSVSTLRGAAGSRQLRLGVRGDLAWLASFPDVTIAEQDAEGVRLTLPQGTDPLALLDRARAAGHVTDFGLELPTLSQLFLHAAGHEAAR